MGKDISVFLLKKSLYFSLVLFVEILCLHNLCISKYLIKVVFKNFLFRALCVLQVSIVLGKEFNISLEDPESKFGIW